MESKKISGKKIIEEFDNAMNSHILAINKLIYRLEHQSTIEQLKRAKEIMIKNVNRLNTIDLWGTKQDYIIETIGLINKKYDYVLMLLDCKIHEIENLKLADKLKPPGGNINEVIISELQKATKAGKDKLILTLLDKIETIQYISNFRKNEFAALAYLIYNENWIKPKMCNNFSSWLRYFSNCFNVKPSKYKPNLLKVPINDFKVKFPFIEIDKHLTQPLVFKTKPIQK